MNLDDALKTFINESRELLEQMEAALLGIEQQPDDAELINGIFRAAHTIKGSAGLFGLEQIVAFTHVAESVLDRVRDSLLVIDAELVAILLAARDHIGTLIDHLAQGETPDAATHQQGSELTERLHRYLNPTPTATKAAMPVEHAHIPERETGRVADTDNWHISLRFGRDVLRNGMDPLAFLRYLGTLGQIVRIVTLTDDTPVLSELDAEACWLGFEIVFSSDADKATIESAFDFVREDSHIRILPPRSRIAEYLRLIDALPNEDMRLGEILVRCGTLTPAELDSMLEMQRHGDATQHAPIGEVLVEQKVVQEPVVEAALVRQKQIKENRNAQNASIRVDSTRLDQLINLVGELIIVGSSANLIARQIAHPALLEVTYNMTRMVEEVRDSAMSLRMVQIGATFSRFQRVVHDVAQELGKDIRLEISGGETELDKTVVEKITDPLTHLVRNAMDHGIESRAQRAANGKPEQGVLRLNAWHDSGSIVIEVADDGGGLNTEKIRAKAIERGLITADAVMSEHDIHQLIFAAGFSTADAVSNLSGRGVGMDVVRSNIESLRGSVELLSQAGAGTAVRIHLPLTLAIIDGFLVGVGRERYVIPLETVEECIQFSAAELNLASGEAGYMDLRGEVLPCVRLRDVFDVRYSGATRESIVVVRHGARRVGLVVNALYGELQAVIKPLGRLFEAAQGVGGFTILGDGEVTPVIDVARLIELSAGPLHSRAGGLPVAA